MKLNNLDFNKLAIFCQVIESGNYRLASEELNVTPSALSQSIARLEHGLGFPLFYRGGRGLTPTPSGRKLHREFRRYQGGFLAAIEDLSQSQNKLSGTIRVGAYLEFAKAQLTPAIHSFSRKYPEAELKLSFDMPSRMYRNLERGSLDLCFSIYPSLERRKVNSLPVYHDELVLIAPGGLLTENPSFEEILEAPLVEYYANHQPTLRWLHLHFRKRPKKLPVRIYASTAEMVLALVGEGAGIGLVPKYVLDTSTTKKAVRIVRPSSRRLLDHIWLLEGKNARSPLHQEFRRHVLEHFGV